MADKKGISPLVATVVLIGFVIVVIIIVILWGTDFAKERAEKSGKLDEAARDCLNVVINVERNIQDDGFLIHNEGNLAFEGVFIKQHCEGNNPGCGGGCNSGDIADTRVFSTVGVGGSLEVVKSNQTWGGRVTPPAVLYLCAGRFEIIPTKIPSGRGAPMIPCSGAKVDAILG